MFNLLHFYRSRIVLLPRVKWSTSRLQVRLHTVSKVASKCRKCRSRDSGVLRAPPTPPTPLKRWILAWISAAFQFLPLDPPLNDWPDTAQQDAAPRRRICNSWNFIHGITASFEIHARELTLRHCNAACWIELRCMAARGMGAAAPYENREKKGTAYSPMLKRVENTSVPPLRIHVPRVSDFPPTPAPG